MFPAFAHFRRTATKDTELQGQEIKEGEKVVMWYVSSNRDETRYEDPDHFDVRRNPEHQAFGAGGRHFCLGAALARLELKILVEETLASYPQMELDGEPKYVVSGFVNQLRTLPVKLNGPRLRPTARGSLGSMHKKDHAFSQSFQSSRCSSPWRHRLRDFQAPGQLGRHQAGEEERDQLLQGQRPFLACEGLQVRPASRGPEGGQGGSGECTGICLH